jgi:hypothetical protein
VHSYCLMTNRLHLLLTPARAEGCALLLKNIGQRDMQYVNRAYQRSGRSGKGGFAPACCKPRTTCRPAPATSSGIRCAPTWCVIRACTAGRAIAATPRARAAAC